VPSTAQLPLQGRISTEKPAVVGEASFSGAAFTDNKLGELASQGIVFGQSSNSNSLDLIRGNVLFMPQSDISVRTDVGTAYIPKGAAAWIVHNGSTTAVYDLHDNIRPVVSSGAGKRSGLVAWIASVAH